MHHVSVIKVFTDVIFSVSIQDVVLSFTILQVMMKSAKLEWQLGCLQKALELLAEGVKEYGDFAKVKCQICNI